MRKIKGLGWLSVAAVAAALLAGGSSARASTYYTVDVTGATDNAILFLVVNGTTVTGISGSIDGYNITGLSGYAGADQQWVYPTASYVDFSGLSFATNNSGEDFNLGWTGSVYGLANSIDDPNGYCCGDYPVTLSVTQTSSGGAGATPVPASLPLFMGGLFLIGLLALQTKRKGAAAMPAAWS